jgi:hypothetical protein
MSKIKKKRRKALPYYSSIVPFELKGWYKSVTKTSGQLYQDGDRSIWLSPYNQLIFNLPRKYNFQGTLITTLATPLTDLPQTFTYFEEELMIRRIGEGVQIGENINLIWSESLRLTISEL